MRQQENRHEGKRDDGMTLIEVLVAIGLFGVLGTILLGLAISTSNVTGSIRQTVSVGEEARTGMERITRELRQAARITAVHLPVTADDETSFTLWADFNGNKCIDAESLDPEELTYTWDPGAKELTLTAKVEGASRTEQLLAAKVSDFGVELRSSAWQYDLNQDGTTTWQELNTSSIGDRDERNFTLSELKHVDLVELTLTAVDAAEVAEMSREIEYSTQVDLRNRKHDGEMEACEVVPVEVPE